MALEGEGELGSGDSVGTALEGVREGWGSRAGREAMEEVVVMWRRWGVWKG